MGRATSIQSMRLHLKQVSLHEMEPTEKNNNSSSFLSKKWALCVPDMFVYFALIVLHSTHIHEIMGKGSGQGNHDCLQWLLPLPAPSHFHLLEAASAAL